MNSRDSFDNEALAHLIAKVLVDKKGTDIAILDMRKLQSAPSSFFVICSGNVPSHVAALSDAVFDAVKRSTGQNPHEVEGYNNAEWILMDYFDVVVHIFQKDKRQFYRLDDMWADAARTEMAG